MPKPTNKTTPLLDDAEVLRQVNLVRKAWGLPILDELPGSVPGHTCACVLGSSWELTLHYSGKEDIEPGPDGVSRASLVTFCLPNARRAALMAEALKDEGARLQLDSYIVQMPGTSPLMEWMFHFDSGKIPHLIDRDHSQYEEVGAPS